MKVVARCSHINHILYMWHKIIQDIEEEEPNDDPHRQGESVEDLLARLLLSLPLISSHSSFVYLFDFWHQALLKQLTSCSHTEVALWNPLP